MEPHQILVVTFVLCGLGVGIGHATRSDSPSGKAALARLLLPLLALGLCSGFLGFAPALLGVPMFCVTVPYCVMHAYDAWQRADDRWAARGAFGCALMLWLALVGGAFMAADFVDRKPA